MGSAWRWDGTLVLRSKLVHPIDGVFSPSCDVSSVVRFRKLDAYPVLITTSHPTGVPGLPAVHCARVKRWLQLCHRCCVHARYIYDIMEATSYSKLRPYVELVKDLLLRVVAAHLTARSSSPNTTLCGRLPVSSSYRSIAI